jgi:hypothetical protein
VLRNFFGVLKGGNVNEALQFVFITGISKFARVSIFSELNNLNDLTMHPAYAELLGYTQEELERAFADYIRGLAEDSNESERTVLDKLKTWYNGYRFTVKEALVYNPYSIVNVFEKGLFQNYWFETATPAFLVNLIKENKYPIADIENLQLQETSFSAYELERLDLEPLLFQTGYITIHEFDGARYRLGYPNQEVKTAFLSHLYKNYGSAFSRPDLPRRAEVQPIGGTGHCADQEKKIFREASPKRQKDFAVGHQFQHPGEAHCRVASGSDEIIMTAN